MSKVRLLVLLLTFIIVGIFGTIISLYARGYRFNYEESSITPNGLLVMKSYPDGAQIYINGELKTATNATIPLPPATYDVSVRKEGFKEWNKRLTIEKEVVTEATAHLLKSVPSLTAITFSGILASTPSHDFTKIAYIIPVTPESNGGSGLWVMDTLDLPLGFARDPRRISDGNLEVATFEWSPDGAEILLTTDIGSYLLDTTKFTPQAQRVNVGSQLTGIKEKWSLEKEKIISAQSRKLPDPVEEIVLRKAHQVLFSPDEDMLVYTASAEAEIPSKLVKELPGASTQREERNIKPDHTYVYDIKEDKNFLIDDHSGDLQIEGGTSDGVLRRISWYPSSRNLILAEPNQIIIMDYDGTNRQIVYSGNYLAPNAFPTLSLDRLLILTNLGAADTLPNLYSVSLK